MTTESPVGVEREETAAGTVVDLLLGLYVGLWGVAFVLVGLVVVRVVSLDASVAVLERIGAASSPTLLETASRTLLWTGAATVVSGVLLVAGACWVGIRNTRARRGGHLPLVRRDPVTTTLAGAVVTSVTASVPLSPVLGGAVSGYLGGGESRPLALGVVSGLLPVAPVALPVLALAGALAVGGFTLSAVSVLVVFGGLLAYTGVLGAVGGLLGRIAAERLDRKELLEK